MTIPSKDDDGQKLMAATFGFGASQTLAVVVGNTQSVAVAAAPSGGGYGTRLVRIVATTLCYIKIGANPIADTTTCIMLAPNFPEYFQIKPGDKVGFIRDAADGKINISEVI